MSRSHGYELDDWRWCHVNQVINLFEVRARGEPWLMNATE